VGFCAVFCAVFERCGAYFGGFWGGFLVDFDRLIFFVSLGVGRMFILAVKYKRKYEGPWILQTKKKRLLVFFFFVVAVVRFHRPALAFSYRMILPFVSLEVSEYQLFFFIGIFI
jgi:hypothetical protein